MLGTVAELDYMLADAGVPVVYGAQSTSGLLDVLSLDELMPEGIRIGERSIRVGIRDGSLTALVVGGAITVNGASYHIRDCGHPLAEGTRYLTLADG
jgi:hypothetical protein